MTTERLDDDERALLDCYVEGLTEEHGRPLTRKERFDAGMFVASRFLHAGQFHSREKLGAFTGSSRQAIEHIELRGLRKCRRGGLLVIAKEYFPNGVNGHGPTLSL